MLMKTFAAILMGIDYFVSGEYKDNMENKIEEWLTKSHDKANISKRANEMLLKLGRYCVVLLMFIVSLIVVKFATNIVSDKGFYLILKLIFMFSQLILIGGILFGLFYVAKDSTKYMTLKAMSMALIVMLKRYPKGRVASVGFGILLLSFVFDLINSVHAV